MYLGVNAPSPSFPHKVDVDDGPSFFCLLYPRKVFSFKQKGKCLTSTRHGILEYTTKQNNRFNGSITRHQKKEKGKGRRGGFLLDPPVPFSIIISITAKFFFMIIRVIMGSNRRKGRKEENPLGWWTRDHHSSCSVRVIIWDEQTCASSSCCITLFYIFSDLKHMRIFRDQTPSPHHPCNSQRELGIDSVLLFLSCESVSKKEVEQKLRQTDTTVSYSHVTFWYVKMHFLFLFQQQMRGRIERWKRNS